MNQKTDQNEKKKREQKEYQEYVKTVTPVHNLWLNKEISASWCAVILVFLSALLTGLNIYPRIAKWGGAGALVPITGFANSVAAPAIEYKKEGQVMGIGCKIFTIAGPVILYGTVISWALGLVWWIGSFL